MEQFFLSRTSDAGQSNFVALRAQVDALVPHSTPAHIFVFEMYADVDAYKAHLKTDHFKKYKVTTLDMVKSLKLRETVPILLGAKSR